MAARPVLSGVVLRLIIVVLFTIGAVMPFSGFAIGQLELNTSDIAVEHHDGQTFVTWTDAAVGAADARYRYSLYRSDKPITEETLSSADLVQRGIIYNSAKLYGSDFGPADRLDPSKPTAKIRTGGALLPQWSGLAVHTAKRVGNAYYAVVVTEQDYRRHGRIIPGVNATTSAVAERVAPVRPIQMYRAEQRAEGISSAARLHRPGLPLMLQLHASGPRGGEARLFGDNFLYFGTEQMGYRDGMAGVFSVAPAIWVPGDMLELFPRDAILKPDGAGALETDWFGYYCVPQWAADKEPHAYPFTENRLLWMLDWTIRKYAIDPNRVYASGYSMGGWGTATFAFRRGGIFAAVFPQMPRFRQRALPSLVPVQGQPTLPDGSGYFDRMDLVKLAAESSSELPFLGWVIGRHDGYASWKEQVDMVRAMTAARRGFSFAWNNGGHSEGTAPMKTIWQYYPPEKFRLNHSYPAFSESSIDNDPGNGDPMDGDPEGGINLGFNWSTPVETTSAWSTEVSNSLARTAMTVDVTPRRMQKFKLAAGSRVAWHASSGQAGTAIADPRGSVTIHRLEIMPGQATTLTLTRQ